MKRSRRNPETIRTSLCRKGWNDITTKNFLPDLFLSLPINSGPIFFIKSKVPGRAGMTCKKYGNFRAIGTLVYFIIYAKNDPHRERLCCYIKLLETLTTATHVPRSRKQSVCRSRVSKSKMALILYGVECPYSKKDTQPHTK